MNQKNKLRISYSLLNLWEHGRREDAMKLYLHVEDKEPTEAMKRGMMFDRMVKEIVMKESRLPDELGGIPLTGDVIANQKIITPFADFDLSAELDIRAGNDIIEIKCSEIMDSSDYANTLQVPFYLFTAELAGQPATRGMVYRYNPAKHNYDVSILYWNDRVRNEVDTIITKYGFEIEQAFQKEGIL